MHDRWRRQRRAGTGLAALGLLLGGLLPTGGASAATEDDGTFLGTAEDFGLATELTDRSTPTGAWLVELAGEPVMAGGSDAEIAHTREHFLDDAAALGVDLELRREFSRTWNGVSVRVEAGEVGALAEITDVVGLYPVMEVPAPTPGPDRDAGTGPGLELSTVADARRPDGEGVSVGVIGTGVDYDHPALGGTGQDGATAFPTDRVTHGRDLVGDSYDAAPSSPTYQPVPEPDEDPDDCNGLGTHVAGTIAGEGTGLAPGATLGAYRVFGCSGASDSDVVLAAMELAAADGMDVVSVPLGLPFMSWPDYPTASAADTLVDAGVVVVAAIGDSGEYGTWSASAPGVSAGTIGVASFESADIVADAFRVRGTTVPFVPAGGAPEPPAAGSLRLSRAGAHGSLSALGCSPSDGVDGTAVLVQRGSCTFYEKASAAQESGAAALVIYNSSPGTFSPTVAGRPEITIPVVAISLEDGLALGEVLAGGSADLTWTEDQVSAPNPNAGLVSSFSSYGLTADLRLKPDLGAPGGHVTSLYPVERGGQATLSGTATAAAHVSGAAALLLQDQPGLDPDGVRSVLQSTAEPALWSLSPSSGLLEPVHRQGAGLVDVDAALAATTDVSPAALTLGEGQDGPVRTSVTVTSTATEEVTYTVSTEHAVSTAGAPGDPGFYAAEATVEVPRRLTVPAGGSADLEVTINPPPAEEPTQYGGYLVLTPDEGTAVRVPFAGLSGDYQQLRALGDPGDEDVPALATLAECDRLLGTDCVDPEATWDRAGEGTVYSMAAGDVPTVLLHLQRPVEQLSFRILEATADGDAGRPLSPATAEYLTVHHVGRDGAAFTPWTWDGTVRDGGSTSPVPDGDYVIEVSVLRAQGDPGDAEHVESWTSPAFTVERAEDGRDRRATARSNGSPG